MMMMPEEPGDQPLDQEKYLLVHAKKIALMVSGMAAMKYGKALDKEQEILVNIADIVNELFAVESAILRTEKAIAASGLDKNTQKLAYTQIFTQEAFIKIEAHAKESLIAMEEGDSLRMNLSALRKLTRFTPINVIAKKREVAKRIFEAEKYIV